MVYVKGLAECLRETIMFADEKYPDFLKSYSDIAELASRVCRKIGVWHKVYMGVISSPATERLNHVWVELEEWVIETNPEATFGISPELPIVIVNRSWWHNSIYIYNVVDVPAVYPDLGKRNPKADRIFEELADMAVECYRRRVSEGEVTP